MARKTSPESKPSQPGKKAQAGGQSGSREAPWSPDAEMAEILYRAGLKEFHTVTAEERRGLRVEEIRQLHIARLLQRGSQHFESKRGGGPKPHPNRAVIIQRHRESGISLKETARWTVEETAEGRLAKPVSAKTLSGWLREGK